jgi:hypothetical protein
MRKRQRVIVFITAECVTLVAIKKAIPFFIAQLIKGYDAKFYFDAILNTNSLRGLGSRCACPTSPLGSCPRKRR